MTQLDALLAPLREQCEKARLIADPDVSIFEGIFQDALGEYFIRLAGNSLSVSELAFLERDGWAAEAQLFARCREDISKLLAVIDRIMSEVKRSTDKAFYEHLESKIAAILEGK